MRKFSVRRLTTAAIVGALYAALTLLSSAFGIAYGPVQFRLSEALCVLPFLFPEAASEPETAACLSGNFTANLLGLGNAATPMGIRAARRLRKDDTASDELCRLIVLNTASIQLIPANVAAIRSSLGCAAPFDILPAVWITSLLSAGLGLTAAVLLGRVWKS